MEAKTKSAIKKAVDLEILKNNFNILILKGNEAIKSIDYNTVKMPELLEDNIKNKQYPRRLSRQEFFKQEDQISLIKLILVTIINPILIAILLIIGLFVAIFLVVCVIILLNYLFNFSTNNSILSFFNAIISIVIFGIPSLLIAYLLFVVFSGGLKSDSKVYRNYLEKYDKEYELKVKEIAFENQKNKVKFDNERMLYSQVKQEEAKTKGEINASLKSLISNIALIEEDLELLYNSFDLHAKYRNLFCISKINEYVETRRVDDLFGKDGALNLLENEMRQDQFITYLKVGNENLKNMSGVLGKINSNVNVIQRYLLEINTFAQEANIQAEQKMEKLIEINKENLLASESNRAYQEYVLMRNGFYY